MADPARRATTPGTPPVTDGPWLRPSPERPAEPRWGHVDGLQVGLHPLPGPRGLLRLFTPYLGHDRLRLLNFVAVEPIAAGESKRGFSELEPSDLDGVRGKRFWTSDHAGDTEPSDPRDAARGVVEQAAGTETLTVWVHSERFNNGAEVSVRVRFFADRPREVSLAAYRRDGSVDLAHCVLTATMGNFARLRHLHLRDRVVTPADLWPGFTRTDFTDHGRFPLAELPDAPEGGVVVAATPDEAVPQDAVHMDGTAEHWRYVGARAVQGWRVPAPSPDLQVLVNGRWAYWASESPIPGGVSYENFEILEPFRDGQEFIYWADALEADFSWNRD